MAYIFLAIAVIFGIIYLVKINKSKNLFSKAVEAKTQGDDKLAISLFKQALGWSNEKPGMETNILSELKELYAKHNLKFDFADYDTLIKQFRTLQKKSSNKSMREMGEVNKLKRELIAKMPDLSGN